MVEPDRPLIIVGNDDALRAAAAELESAGWRLRSGWDLPEVGWHVQDARLVCIGPVADGQDTAAVVLAAARGVGVVAMSEDVEVRGRLYRDLTRLGRVEVRSETGTSVLDIDQRRLLELLGEGRSVGEAAAALHLSVRSAQRRLEGARRALDVRTNTEAVLAVRRGRGGALGGSDRSQSKQGDYPV